MARVICNRNKRRRRQQLLVRGNEEEDEMVETKVTAHNPATESENFFQTKIVGNYAIIQRTKFEISLKVHM